MYENGYPLRYFNNDATLQKEKRKMALSRFVGPKTKNSVFTSMIF